MTPVLGQGCNSGLEDATVFARMLQQCDGDIDRLLPAYTAARLPEITALLNINEVAAQERHTLKVGHPVIIVSYTDPENSWLTQRAAAALGMCHSSLRAVGSKPQSTLCGSMSVLSRLSRPISCSTQCREVEVHPLDLAKRVLDSKRRGRCIYTAYSRRLFQPPAFWPFTAVSIVIVIIPLPAL